MYSDKNKVFYFILLNLIFFLNTFHTNAQSEPEIFWEELEPDLYQASVNLPSGLLTSQTLNLYKTSLNKFSLQIIRASKFGKKDFTSKEMCILSKSTLCINSSFFDEQKRPLGLLIDRGITIQKLEANSSLLTGVLQVIKNKPSIIHRNAFEQKSVNYALQAGPRLIADGKPISGLKNSDISDKRSGICIDDNQNLIFYILSSPLGGITTTALQTILINKNINCQEALNLDGGSSSQLYYQPSQNLPNRKNIELSGRDSVPVGLSLVKIDDD